MTYHFAALRDGVALWSRTPFRNMYLSKAQLVPNSQFSFCDQLLSLCDRRLAGWFVTACGRCEMSL
jgi:hypothetical protein